MQCLFTNNKCKCSYLGCQYFWRELIWKNDQMDYDQIISDTGEY